MAIQPVVGRPGIGSARTTSRRNVLRSRQNARYFPGGGVIDGTSRDFGNTDNLFFLRAGLLMGRDATTKQYEPSLIGLTDVAYASGTSLSLTEASGNELVRRVGSSGTFKLTGPPTANGTVRTVQVTYSAVAAAGSGHRVVTITALPVAAVWTLVHAAGTDGGTYRLKVTTPDGVSAITAALAWNADTATVDAALEALANVGVAGVAAVFAVDTLTLTFAATLGDVRVEVVNDLTADGGVYEGGWEVTHTATGVDGRFVTGSFVQPEDGSETPRTVISDDQGILVPSDSSDVDFPHILTGGDLDSSQILNWPSDTSLRQWIVDALNANGYGRFTFDHLLGPA